MGNQTEDKQPNFSGLKTFDFGQNTSTGYVCNVNTGICGPIETNNNNQSLNEEK